MIALIVALVALALILLRVPVAFALLIPSIGYIFFQTNMGLTVAIERMTSSLNSFPLLAVPMFILVGSISNVAGISERIFNAANAVVGRVRGGLGYVNVTASLGFSWMSGAAASDVAVMGRILVPQMQRRGYSDRYATGLTAASSLVTPIMPPSIPAIMFGVASGVSIGAMFTASIVPAIILTVVLLGSVAVYAFRHPELADRSPRVRGERRKAVIPALPILAAPVIILGGILGGFFTPTEAAAVAVAFLFLLGLAYRSLTWKGIATALKETFSTSVTILLIVASSALFGWVLTMERVPMQLAELIRSFTDEPVVFLLLMLAALLIIGMVMEPTSAILITTPVLFPVAMEMQIDPLQFGIVLISALLIGLFTPPVGLVLFVMESVTNVKSTDIILGVVPYVLMFIGFLLLIIFFPGITTWLPGLVA